MTKPREPQKPGKPRKTRYGFYTLGKRAKRLPKGDRCRFPLLMTLAEREMLSQLSFQLRISACAVLRGLIREAAQADRFPGDEPEGES